MMQASARMADDGRLDAADTVTSNTISSPRHVRFPPEYFDHGSGNSSAIHSLTSASTLSTLESKLDLSPGESAARKGLLRETVFNEWKNDAPDMEADNPEEMQKKDPLGTQIWKLYHKQKGQLPNSERLENLSWRMMSMNLRKKELERKKYVRDGSIGYAHALTCAQSDCTPARPEYTQWHRPAPQVVRTGECGGR